jgi:hypothetical protein
MPNIEDDLDELSLDYNKPFKKQRAFYSLIFKAYIITKNEDLNKISNSENKVIIYKNNTKDLMESKNYKEAYNSKYSPFWLRSELKELNILYNNNIWELVPKSNNIKVLISCWAYKIKNKSNYFEFKSRFCIKSFIQLYGLDYIKTFVRVIKQMVWRLLFALIILNNWFIYKIDIIFVFI